MALVNMNDPAWMGQYLTRAWESEGIADNLTLADLPEGAKQECHEVAAKYMGYDYGVSCYSAGWHAGAACNDKTMTAIQASNREASKDALIASLQAEIKELKLYNETLGRDNQRMHQSLCSVADISGSATRELDKLIGELAASKAIAEERMQLYVDANELAIELQEKLNIAQSEIVRCMDQISELEAALLDKAEPRPNTRDMSRVANFSESHARNGLPKFDRYY